MDSRTRPTLLPTTAAAAALLALCALLAPPGAAGQVERPEQIVYPPLGELEIPEPTRVVLPNGLVVLVIEDHELPLVRATALVRTGGRHEPADHLGLAEIAGEVLRTGGTATWSGDELDDYLEGKAAFIEAGIGETTGRVVVDSLAEDFPEVFRAFAEVLRRPRFEEAKIEVAKTAVAAGIARQNDNPQTILGRELDEVVYGEGSPYARQPTYATLAAIDRDDLVAWHERWFHPERTVLGIVGDIETEAAIELARRTLGDWPRSGADPGAVPTVDARPAPGVYFVDKDDVTQSTIGIAHLGIQRDHPDYWAVEILNHILSGSQSSRLFNEVRTVKGLAYAVTGSVGAGWDHPGRTLLFTTTRVEQTGAAVEALLEEVEKLRGSAPPTAEEVEKAKRALVTSFVFEVDSRDEVLGNYLTYEYYGYPLDRLERYRESIEAVTLDQVRAAAREHLRPEELAIVVVGPTDEGLARFAADGRVTPIDITIPPPPAPPRAEATPEGEARAGELLDAAAAALGGAERLAAVDALRLVATGTQTSPMGTMEVGLEVIYDYPDRLRQELAFTMGELTVVVTPEDAFVVMPQGVQPLPSAQAEEARRDLVRSPLALLRLRGEDGFAATAAGAGTVGETPVEHVEVTWGDLVVTLGIDPESGRVLSLAYQGTGPGGAPGETVETFSDFREVGGLVLPYSRSSTFDGEPLLDVEITEIEVDPELGDDLFARPGG